MKLDNNYLKKTVNFLGIKELSKGLKLLKFSSLDICDFHIRFFSNTNHKINAGAQCDKNDFLNLARQSDNRRLLKLSLSAYDGIPLSIKSNILNYGFINDACSNAISNRTWLSSKLVDSLSRLGFLIHKKTNSDEFAMGSKTRSSKFGKVYNP